ncbi:MAG: aa3-type cytochrome c oxidase subunit IV [Caulobacterales bacterium]
MAEADHEYHRGQQDVSEQVATFHTFGGLVKWGCLTLAVLLLMLIMWFCTGAGFLAGLISGVVVLAAGIVFLRSGPSEEEPIAGH